MIVEPSSSAFSMKYENISDVLGKRIVEWRIVLIKVELIISSIIFSLAGREPIIKSKIALTEEPVLILFSNGSLVKSIASEANQIGDGDIVKRRNNEKNMANKMKKMTVPFSRIFKI